MLVGSLQSPIRHGIGGAYTEAGWTAECGGRCANARPDPRGGAMSKYVRWLIVPVVAVLAACGGQSESDRLDEALTRDLALAASMQYPQQQFMSPMEMGYGQYPQPM